MRLKSPESDRTTTAMEKKARLETLFRTCLTCRDGAAPTVLLLAQSLDSPVVMAMENIVFSAPQGSIALRMILTRLDTRALSADAAPSVRHGISCRLLRDPRFLEAHEQVVLGNSTVWIGDSMRRDPSKRDCLEAFFENDKLAATNAAQSFERLWNLAQPVRVTGLNAAMGDTSALDAAAAAQIAGADIPLRADTTTPRN